MKEQESLLSRRAVLAGTTLAMMNAAAVRGSQANSKISVGLIGSGGRGSYDASIVNVVINMGKSFNKRIVAEGVETPEQYAFLLTQNCDEGQGYYFGRPMAAEAFATFR